MIDRVEGFSFGWRVASVGEPRPESPSRFERRMTRVTRMVILLFLMAGVAGAASGDEATWTPVVRRCGLCGTANDFARPGAADRATYRRPERFEYVFWPYTASESLYRCSNCNFICWYWDWELKGVSKQKRNQLKATLRGVRMGWPSARYTMIPMVERLAVAEKVYGILGNDDEFWCRFYRVLGHHLERDGRAEAARGARAKALAIADPQARLDANRGTRKEWLFICGAMRYFLGDTRGAREDFLQARKLRYSRRALKPQDEKAINGYLSELLKEYLKAIENPARGAEIRPTVGKAVR